MTKTLLQQVKAICQTYDIKPDKQKGQNFLVNTDVLANIIVAADLQPSDAVLEVGPGLGILTEALVKRVSRVISVELDKKLFTFLKTQFVSAPNLELVNEDILKFNPVAYNLQPTSYKLVANLPYNITSHFLKKFLTMPHRPSSMTLLVQKEVAERICAQPGQLSLLGLSVQLYSQPSLVSVVNQNSFWPAPAVESAILNLSSVQSQIEVDKRLNGVTEDKFWQLARIGFSAKRKQLPNNLAAGLHISSLEAKSLVEKAGFNPKIRAQNLSIDDWSKLAKLV